MSTIDSLYYNLRKNKKKFNIARFVTVVLVLIPIAIGYAYNQYIWIALSFVLLVLMMAFVGIPTQKEINKLKKEINRLERNVTED